MRRSSRRASAAPAPARRQVDDHLARADPAELVARDALDGGRIVAQRLGLAREPLVLGRQLLVVGVQRGQITPQDERVRAGPERT